MSEEYYARCDYCGATKSHRWIKGRYGLYCSIDCLLAGNVWGFAFALFLIVLLNLFSFALLGMHAFPAILGFSLFAIIFLFLDIMGIRARKRIKHWHVN